MHTLDPCRVAIELLPRRLLCFSMSGRLQAEAHAEGQKEVITAKSACGMALRGSALPLRYVPDPSNHAQFLPELFNSAEEAKVLLL